MVFFTEFSESLIQDIQRFTHFITYSDELSQSVICKYCRIPDRLQTVTFRMIALCCN